MPDYPPPESVEPPPPSPPTRPLDARDAPVERRARGAARRPWAPLFTALILLLMATASGLGGATLALQGGSWYYLAAAAGFGLTAALLLRRSQAAYIVYSLFLAGTLAWALQEASLDWWPLAARLDVPFVVGLWLARGRIARALRARAIPPAATRVPGIMFSRGGLAVMLALYVATALAAALAHPHEQDGRLDAQAPAASSPIAAVAAASAAAVTASSPIPDGDWPAYGRTAAGQRYSPLAQLTPANVDKLQVAWQFRTGDLRGKPGDPEETTDEVTPLKVGSRLYLCTPHQAVIALDATTGKQLWRRDLPLPDGLALQHLTCRGVTYQAANLAANAATAAAQAAATSASAPAPAPGPSGCTEKLFMASADGHLYALDPATGASCPGFGQQGAVDLMANMPNAQRGAYYSTSPVVVARGMVIVGGTVLDNASTREQSGVIRGYDAETGKLKWNWDSGRPASTAPVLASDQYTPNSPNSWSIASADEALGMVYVPMGNQPPDQWGGHRSAAVETYSSSVVALDIADGHVHWAFQTVHHDLWDYDVPAQPTLVDLTINGQVVPALVQPTKQGEIFVLDRRTGTPVLPVQERPAPQGAAPGDRTAVTQPKSALSFEPAPLRESDMWGGTMFDQLMCRIAFRQLRYDGRFTPPSTQGTLVHPGNFGVFNWGGVAVDPVRQVAFVTPAMLAFTSTLVPRHDETSLLVQDKGPPKGALPALNENFGAPFAARMGPFLSPFGLPCQAPPWGTVAAVDLRTGQVAWRHRNGTVRDLSPLPLPFHMGVPSLGGAVVTAGGLAFLSGSMDDYVRGYDMTDGHVAWEQRLPAGGQATPMSYLGADGRQYLLVVAGGHGSTHTRPGDYVIAYALPK